MDPAPPPEEEVPKIEKDAVFTINENFRSKKQKVNINIPMRREKEEENEETHKAVEEDRKLQIQVHHHLLIIIIIIVIFSSLLLQVVVRGAVFCNDRCLYVLMKKTTMKGPCAVPRHRPRDRTTMVDPRAHDA